MITLHTCLLVADEDTKIRIEEPIRYQYDTKDEENGESSFSVYRLDGFTNEEVLYKAICNIASVLITSKNIDCLKNKDFDFQKEVSGLIERSVAFNQD